MRRLIPFAAVVVLLGGGDAQAQDQEAPTWQEEQIADIEQMRDKFVSLAKAFPADAWQWRPMEGVRSVQDVVALMSSEGYHFPTMWGAEVPEGVGENFEAEMDRIRALDREVAIAEMEKALNNMIEIAKGYDAEGLQGDARWFGGRTVPVSHAITLSAFDMHEHLGQLIAYARTNHVVPPWSM